MNLYFNGFIKFIITQYLLPSKLLIKNNYEICKNELIDKTYPINYHLKYYYSRNKSKIIHGTNLTNINYYKYWDIILWI